MNAFQRLYLWACERLYAELAWSYDLVSWLVSFGHWSSWRATLLPYLGKGRILEIGFGTGTLLTTMAQQERDVIGLELSTAMHNQTTRKLFQHRLIVPRVQSPAQQMPFADGSFDTIIATFPSDYITERATLAECARLLRCPTVTEQGNVIASGGRLFVILGVTASRSPLGLITRLLKGSAKGMMAETDLHPLPAYLQDVGLRSSAFSLVQGDALVHIVAAEHEVNPRSNIVTESSSVSKNISTHESRQSESTDNW